MLPGVNGVQALRIPRCLAILNVFHPHAQIALVLSHHTLENEVNSIPNAVVADQRFV